MLLKQWLTIFHVNWVRDYQETPVHHLGARCVFSPPIAWGRSPASADSLSTKERTWCWLLAHWRFSAKGPEWLGDSHSLKLNGILTITYINLSSYILATSGLLFMWEKELLFKPVFFEFLLNIDWDNLNTLILAGAYVASVMSDSLQLHGP